MTSSEATLHFFCGKMASGKSTLARKIAADTNGVLICEDLWLSKLVGDQIDGFGDYLKYAARLKEVVFPLARDLLGQGVSLVLDFPGNTPAQRRWFRDLFESAGASHCLHCVEAEDSLCLDQLARRNREKPEGSKVMSEEEFAAITAYFQPPSEDEGFRVVTHARK